MFKKLWKYIVGLLVGTALAAGGTIHSLEISANVELTDDLVIEEDYEIKKGKFKMNGKKLKLKGDFTLGKGADMSTDGEIIMANSTGKAQKLKVEQKGIFKKKTPKIGHLIIGESPGLVELESDVDALAVTISSGAKLDTKGFFLGVGTGSLTVNGELDARGSDVYVLGSVTVRSGATIKPGKEMTIDSSEGELRTYVTPAKYYSQKNSTGGILDCGTIADEKLAVLSDCVGEDMDQICTQYIGTGSYLYVTSCGLYPIMTETGSYVYAEEATYTSTGVVLIHTGALLAEPWEIQTGTGTEWFYKGISSATGTQILPAVDVSVAKTLHRRTVTTYPNAIYGTGTIVTNTRYYGLSSTGSKVPAFWKSNCRACDRQWFVRDYGEQCSTMTGQTFFCWYDQTIGNPIEEYDYGSGWTLFDLGSPVDIEETYWTEPSLGNFHTK